MNSIKLPQGGVVTNIPLFIASHERYIERYKMYHEQHISKNGGTTSGYQKFIKPYYERLRYVRKILDERQNTDRVRP